ncbi:MAG: 3-deoxy-D-manno-octulosonic acid transferase [Syntrophorhabdaceae bacterium PtaU1.Bin034]|nr:MAG: 3-deoxy-D-manno-octulosonic acid transferase [Syntrophorhabdaceae bacterium PtaU1.Bin034]
MWKLIYNLLIYSLFPFFAVFSLTNKKVRTNFRERMLPKPVGGNMQDPLWIHAASLGEAVIAENFITYVRPKIKNDIVVTTNTYYTRDLLRRKFGDSVKVFSLPFDFSFSIGRFTGNTRFAALLIIETEIWPNLIWKVKSRGIPVIIINGRISDSTIGRYKRFSFFLTSVLSSVDLVLAQSEEHARRFVMLGISPSKVVNAGNLKYYRKVEGLSRTKSKDSVITFGSVKEKELPILIPVIGGLRKDFPEIRIYIAPRELKLVPEIEKQFADSFVVVRYSHEKQNGACGGEIVLVDTVGDLVGIYAKSKVAFVGGSLAPYGGQNVLEPLFVGTPVIFGPHIDNFKAISQDIITQGAGFMVQDGAELLSRMRMVLTDEGVRQNLAEAGRAVLDMQRNVMEKASRLVLEAVWKNSQNLSS